MIFQLRCYSWRPRECHNDHELCKQVQNTPENVFFVVMFTQPGKMQYFGEIKITNSLSENGDLNMLTWWFSGSKLMPQITTTQLLFTMQPSMFSDLDFLDKNKRIKLQLTWNSIWYDFLKPRNTYREGHGDIIQFLIDNGSDVTRKDYKDRYCVQTLKTVFVTRTNCIYHARRNPLEMAIEKGKQKVIEKYQHSSTKQ